MNTPIRFGDVAATLALNGYRPVPIKRDTKRPPMDGWQDFAYSLGCERQFETCGAGILLGEAVGFDIDVDDPAAVAAIENTARQILKIGNAADVPRRIGNPPRVLLPFRATQPFRKIASASFTMRSTGTTGKVEVLAEGQQFVAFAVHPITQRPYTWNGAGNLLNIPLAALPAITQAQAREMVRAAEIVLGQWGHRVVAEPPTDAPEARPGATLLAGNRNDSLTREAGRLRRLGLSADAMAAALQHVNLERCNPTLERDEVNHIARSIARYEPADSETTYQVWPDPQPLPFGLPAVAPFEFDLLPQSLRSWGADIADRMRCPAEYIGVPIMAAVAAVVGRKIAIRPKQHDDWSVIPNMWAFLIGRPGVLKSPAMEEALKPVKRLIALAIEQHQCALTAHRAKSVVAKMKNDAINKAAARVLLKDPAATVTIAADDDDEAPLLHRYMTNDSSMAALAELLRQNPNGLLVHRDELVSLLRALDQEDNAEARSFYLTAWNGDSSYTSDRIARGMNLHVEAVCLSLLGSTQPARISEYVATAVRGGAGDDGMLQRFGLMVWPDIAGEWVNVDRAPNHDAVRDAHATFGYLDALDYRAVGARRDQDHEGDETGVPYLRFTPEALEVFGDWRHPLERELRGGALHPALESHFAKYRKLVPALSLLIHLADRGQGAVSADALNLAIAWNVYLRTHAQRIYAAATNRDAIAARAIVKRIRKGDIAASFAGWEIWRKGWALLSDRQTVADALSLLVELGHLRQMQRETNGRTATIYVVNPKTATADQ